MEHFEYTKIMLEVFSEHIIDQYNLHLHALNGFVYLEIQKSDLWA